VLGEISQGDSRMEREIFAHFMAVNENDVESLLRALDERDMSAISHVAHRIRGASSAIGAVALAEVAGRLETAARAKDLGAIVADHEAFRREAGRLNGYLKALAGAVD
jgi:two-component system sensor histidine kinase EvgS